MEPDRPTTLYLLCGKIAAGKSTMARKLAERPRTLLIGEDHWTSHLFRDELRTIDDYSRCSARLRAAMGPHVVAILRQGLSVVLDFPANTVAYRDWMRSLVEDAGVRHELHVMDVADEECRRRMWQRQADGSHPFALTDEDFDVFTSYFVPPRPEEGFNLVVHRD